MFSHCIHGGDKLEVAVPDLSTCNDLTITDALLAFKWTCDDSAGSVKFISLGLKTSTLLSRLLNADSWKMNYVTVYKNLVPMYASLPLAWWSNSVKPLPENASTAVVSLDEESTIYTLAENRLSFGYNIDADKVGLVTLLGATLTLVNTLTGNNCSQNTGEIASGNLKCLLSVGAQKYIWIEGLFTGDDKINFNSGTGILAVNCNYCRFRRLGLTGFNSSGVRLRFTNSSYFSDIIIADSFYGFFLDGGLSTGANIMNHLQIVNSSSKGILANNFIDDQVFVNLLIAGTNGNGLNPINASRFTFQNLTSANNKGAGIHCSNCASWTVNSVLSVNNGSNGLYIRNGSGTSSQNEFSQMVLTNNSEYGVTIEDASVNSYTNNLILGNNAFGTCEVLGGFQPGLIDATCSDTGIEGPSVFTGQSSTAYLGLARDLSTSFVGKSATTDLTNTSNINGQTLFENISDWTQFSSPWRGWGKSGSTFPNADHQGSCDAMGETCQIWDWGLASNDTVVKNRNTIGNIENDPFLPGLACPGSVHGDKFLSDRLRVSFFPGNIGPETIGDGTGNDTGPCELGEFCHNQFLINATEIFEDGIGDDDGLCESTESCYFSPNFGADQGATSPDTPLGMPCIFQNATLKDILMYQH